MLTEDRFDADVMRPNRFLNDDDDSGDDDHDDDWFYGSVRRFKIVRKWLLNDWLLFARTSDEQA